MNFSSSQKEKILQALTEAQVDVSVCKTIMKNRKTKTATLLKKTHKESRSFQIKVASK